MEHTRTSELASSSAGTLGVDEQLATSCKHYFDQKIVFKPASQPDYYLERLKSLYPPLNPKMPEQNLTSSPTSTNSGDGGGGSKSDEDGFRTTMDGIPTPARVLYNPGQLEMKWRSPRGVGAGLRNMGNTCFLNSVLQCLTYTPPLVNYLSSDHHKKICRGQGFCAMCELKRHIQSVMNASEGVVRPAGIVQNLRVIGKHFRLGRQEDAHEFLRYFVDALQKSSLQGVPGQLDPHSKATTIIHQVFGGYHCSQVRCKECQKTSETFDPLLDLSLDIKSCSNLVQALNRFTKPDSLEGDNQYACPYCKKMTPAQKRFTIHRLPNILTIQLKRFDYDSLFGGKINKAVSYPQYLDMRPYLSSKKGPPQWYQLYGVLVHSGYSCRSGHYYCYTKSANGVWHGLNDSQVYQVSANQVLQQEAYLLFYTRDQSYQPPAHTTPTAPPPSNVTQAKVRPDPTFLGQPVKRSPGLDKMGTPLVKLKPTGIVPPSPQGSSSVSPTQSLSQPPNSLPLRKSDVDLTPKPPPPVVTPPPKPTNVLIKKPSFLPRVIAAPSSKKKKLQVVKSVGSKDKPQDSTQSAEEVSVSSGADGDKLEGEGEGRDNIIQQKLGGDGPLEDVGEKGDSGQLEPTSDVFIGPRLPQHMQSAGSVTLPMSTVLVKSPKIARVQPQVKPAKPVALVHPVVPDSPSGSGKRVEMVTIIKGLAGEQYGNKNAQSQSTRPAWKPVNTPVSSSPPSHQIVGEVERVEKKNDTEQVRQPAELESTPTQEVKKRKKHKKKRSHRSEEREERGESERERKHRRSGAEKSKKHSVHCVESSEEDERPRKKRKTHESRKEKKRSQHQSSHRREHSRSSSSSSSSGGEESDRHYHSRHREHRDRENKKHGEGKKHESGYSDRGNSYRDDRKHGDGKPCHSSSSAPSLHKSRHRSPSPGASRRKRRWSSESEGSRDRRKSLKQDAHHVPKKRHSSEHHSSEHHHHHHKHHDRNRKSKHSSSSRTKYSRSVERAIVSGIPEVEWDSSLRREERCGEERCGEERRGEGEGRGRWDGSRGRDVVETLTSHTPTQLGSKVKSWEGGGNSVDAVSVSGGERRKKERDTWDLELDRGKVKRIKSQKESEYPSVNPFQEFQNRKNTKQSTK